MSYMQQIEKVGEAHYVLPAFGDMRTEVHAFLSEALYAQTDEALWRQTATAACHPGATAMYLMPDCLSVDTEVLTSTGFIPLSDLTVDHEVANVDPGTGSVTFTRPRNVFTRPLRPGERVYAHKMEAFRSTLITTEGHRNAFLGDMGIRSRDLPDETVVRDYLWGGNGLATPDPLGLTEGMLRLLVWVLGDGNIKTTHNKNSTNRRVRFGLKKERKIQRVLELLDAEGLGYTVSASPKQTEIYVNTESSGPLIDMVGVDKDCPFHLVERLTPAEARLMLDEAIQVDGDYENHQKGGAWILYSNDQKVLDFYSALTAINLGLANMRHRDAVTAYSKGRKTRTHRMSVIEASKITFNPNGLHNRKISKQEIAYNGEVGCLTCDTGFFIARREGLTFVTGNCHIGYGIPIGGVLVTDDVIVQAGSGYDISCGVVYLRVPGLHAADIVDWDTRLRWIREVEKRVATGLGNERPQFAAKISHRIVEEVLRHGAKALGISANLCERQFIEIPEDFDSHLVDKAHSKARPQLGSVGGGNHFIEMQVDQNDGSVWVMVHCGSRGYGWQTANWFFYEGARLRGLATNRREESWLRADEALGKLYWAHHNSAANYAVANRWSIVEGVRLATQEIFGKDIAPYYEISHNLVQEETLVLPDGSTKKGFVHRKGATRAFPGGHPDLVGTQWEKTGHPCLIPGSMLAGAAILFPQEGAYKSGCSVNHGSGRTMGRGAAKRELTHIHDDIDAEMKTITRILGGVEVVGIVGNTDRTPLDECGHVYKDLDEVLAVLETEGIAKVKHRLYPVANIKGV